LITEKELKKFRSKVMSLREAMDHILEKTKCERFYNFFIKQCSDILDVKVTHLFVLEFTEKDVINGNTDYQHWEVSVDMLLDQEEESEKVKQIVDRAIDNRPDFDNLKDLITLDYDGYDMSLGMHFSK